MTWSYRIIRYLDGTGYGLHEVFYDDEGLPCFMTEEPISFACDLDEGPEGVRHSLAMALKDATDRPVFDEPEEGKWPGHPPFDKEYLTPWPPLHEPGTPRCERCGKPITHNPDSPRCEDCLYDDLEKLNRV